jgi:8-oxo-dGTP pyrophosphatase MutT (NUDIX family)
MTKILPEKQWLATQPKKLVGAKVVIKSVDGKVLLVKPTYKPTWQLPGGVVEASESPLTAAVREVCEETEITCDEADFQLIDVVFRADQDILFVLYEYTKQIDNMSKLHIQAEELETYEWVSPEEVTERLPKYYTDFWRQYTK